ncbi:MAG: S9 family peptidase [Bacteroidota bacterium]
MKNYIYLCLAAWLGLHSTKLSAQHHPAFSSMDVFELEWVSDPQISPDGKQIVYVRRFMDIMKDRRAARIWLINRDGSDHQKLSNFDVNEGNPRWSPDGSRIAFTASSPQGTELYVYWVASQKIARLSQLPASPSGLSWSPDGKHIAFSMFVPGKELSLVRPHARPAGAVWADPPKVTTRLKHEADGAGKLKPGHAHYFVIPSEGGSYRQITQGNFNHRGAPHWAPDGKTLYFSTNRNENWEYDFRNSEIYALDLETGSVQALTDRKGPDRGVAVSPDGETLAYLGYDDQVQTYQVSHIYLMNKDGSGKKMIKTKLDRNPASLRWDADGKGLYFMYDEYGNTKLAHTTLKGKVTTLTGDLGGTTVARPYGGGSYSVSNSGDLAFTHTTPYHPAELALLAKEAEEPEMVMSLNDDILGRRTLGQVEEIWYTSSVDDRKVQGWIVKPPFFEEGKTYPLLVENHGGPISNYGDRFSPEVQLYASAGFVVFYPNPRGSTSYGEEFGNLLYHNYPGDDYHDVMDGVDAVLKLGYTSEDSLFVTGGSAGGIMSAWMIGKNNRFRAAAVIKPVMNWISKTLTADNYYGYANSRYPGQPWENPETYMKYSPVSLVGNIETPTLVMVGSSDLRTPLSEAKQLYHALKIRQIETALVEVPGAFHFIANRPSQLITKVEHIVAWFDRYR